ncbi:MAG: hypothetical protein JRH20_13185 [Deltaproteobacteria bacterium]|nr:hypothetical protein [Deltaproteobacteria bacterium]
MRTSTQHPPTILSQVLKWAPEPIRKPAHLIFAITLIVLLSALSIRAGIGFGVAPVALAGIGVSSIVSALAMSIVALWTANYMQFRRRGKISPSQHNRRASRS